MPFTEETSADYSCDILMAAGGKRPRGIFNMLDTVKRSRKEKNKGKPSTEGDDGINGNMDQKIWQEFPHDLFEA